MMLIRPSLTTHLGDDLAFIERYLDREVPTAQAAFSIGPGPAQGRLWISLTVSVASGA
jgi:hypothetical protein